RRELENLRDTSAGSLTTNVADATTNLSPFNGALNVGMRYQLDKRLTSRREEIYTNVILSNGVPIQLKPGQGTHVRIDDFHYQEDPDEGDYVRVVRTVGDTPVAAVDAQFRARVEPSRFFVEPQTRRPSPDQPAAEEPKPLWRSVAEAVSGEALWNVTEEQENAALGDVLQLRNLRSNDTVYGQLRTQYRVNIEPSRFLRLDAEWNDGETLNRRLNSQSRTLETTTRRYRLQLMPTQRWTLEGEYRQNRSDELLESIPLNASEVPPDPPPAVLSQLERDERDRSVGARYRVKEQFTVGGRFALETEDSVELLEEPVVASTEVRAVEALLTWQVFGKGRADLTYRLADGRRDGELSAVSGFRFYEGFSQELRARGDYRVQSFTDLTFRLNYRLLATQERPTEHRFDLELVAEL
ncbi:MAG: hypothetical protein O3A46_10870, partial [Candidatus Poribacteria bacterium]|nr:hypothetical protein [Candidatus Poribacteria bacterium]